MIPRPESENLLLPRRANLGRSPRYACKIKVQVTLQGRKRVAFQSSLGRVWTVPKDARETLSRRLCTLWMRLAPFSQRPGLLLVSPERLLDPSTLNTISRSYGKCQVLFAGLLHMRLWKSVEKRNRQFTDVLSTMWITLKKVKSES